MGLATETGIIPPFSQGSITSLLDYSYLDPTPSDNSDYSPLHNWGPIDHGHYLCHRAARDGQWFGRRSPPLVGSRTSSSSPDSLPLLESIEHSDGCDDSSNERVVPAPLSFKTDPYLRFVEFTERSAVEAWYWSEGGSCRSSTASSHEREEVGEGADTKQIAKAMLEVGSELGESLGRTHDVLGCRNCWYSHRAQRMIYCIESVHSRRNPDHVCVPHVRCGCPENPSSWL
jgi:hypothetical protein